MSDFIVSARKYRPLRFGDVVGQQHITTTLRNAIQSGQLAHSFLFCGPRGVGKTTCARILAQSINCESPVDGVEPCGTCGPCKSFRESSSFNIYEIDAASNNSVEDIRALTDQVRFPPQAGRYKVYIIDEVHMLSQAAFNAFLKTLEEPPPYAVFILATTEKHKIIPTILSRCQIFDFNRIQVADIAGHLQGICEAENIPFEPQGLHVIAQKADGGMRDALSMFDRILAFSGGSVQLQQVLDNLNILDYDVFFGLVDAFLAEDLSTVLHTFQRVLERGFEGDIFLSGLAEHLRNLLVAKDPATHDLLELTDALRERYIDQAGIVSGSYLVSSLALLNQADIHFKASRHKRLHVETTLVKLTYLNRAVDLSAEHPVSAAKKKQPADSVRPVGVPIAKSAQAPTVAPAVVPAAPAPPPAPTASEPTPSAPAPTAAKPAPPPAPTASEPTTSAPAQTAATSPVQAAPSKSVAGGLKIPNLKDLSASLQQKTRTAAKEAELKADSLSTEKEQTDLGGKNPAPELAEAALQTLQKAWVGFGQKFIEANRMSVAKLLESAQLQAGPAGQLLVLVHNNIQQGMIKEELPAFREHLMKEGMIVPPILIQIQPDLAQTGQDIPFSAQDRLAKMGEKNPLLHQLREQLGLELEF